MFTRHKLHFSFIYAKLKEISRVGQEETGDLVRCQLETQQVHLITQTAMRFCLVGQASHWSGPGHHGSRLIQSSTGSETNSGSSMATATTDDITLPLRSPCFSPAPVISPLTKSLQLIAFASRFATSADCCLRIYAVLDTPDAVKHVCDTEHRLDSICLNTSKQMQFRNNAGGLVFCIKNLPTQWRCRLISQVGAGY